MLNVLFSIKGKNMKKIIVLVISLVFLNGCAFYNLAKPIEPESRFPRRISTVDTFNPELKWQPEFEGPYDLVVYELTHSDFEFNRIGLPFYMVENQVGTSYKIPKKLNSGKVYFWAVKPHGSDEWSKYKYFAFYGIGYSYYWDQFFRFKTKSEWTQNLEKQKQNKAN